MQTRPPTRGPSATAATPDFPMLMQPPPPALAAAEPPLVRYVVQHTAADGFTLLHDCPAPAAP